MKISIAPLLKQPYGASEVFDISEDRVTPRSDHAALLEVGVRSVSGDVRAIHTNPGVYLEGDPGAEVDLECVRCLDRIRRTVTAHVREQYYALIDIVTGAQLAPPPRDAYTIGHDFKIDITTLLREHIVLELPLKPLCREECAGLCPVCGLDQNEQPHRHESETDERWTGLRTLLEGFEARRRE